MHNRQTSFTVLQCIQDGGIQAEEGVRIIHLSDKFGTVGKRKCEEKEEISVFTCGPVQKKRGELCTSEQSVLGEHHKTLC